MLLRWILTTFGGATGARVHPTRLGPPVATVNGRRAIRVPRNTKPLFEERGWRRDGNVLNGYYRTRLGSFEGRIKGNDYFIINPPRALLNGPHGPCFQMRDRRTYFIHWNKPPKDVNSGILHIEHLLIEALS